MEEEIKKDQPQQNKAIIPQPLQEALYLGAGSGLVSLVLGASSNDLWRISLGVAGVKLVMAGSQSFKAGLKAGRRKRKVTHNSYKGSKTINLEYSIANGGYITRKPLWQDALDLIRPKSGRPQAQSYPATKPDILDEFIFISHHNDRLIQLRKTHVELFLKSAWRNRANGKGLSWRRWVRNFSQRPAWYKELSPAWYYAMMNLLYDCQNRLGLFVVYEEANQWRSLANEPFTTMRLLKWHEHVKRGNTLA